MIAPASVSVGTLLAAAEETFDEHTLVTYLGAIGLVILVSALLSGLVERAPISQVLVFVALGVALGPAGTGTFALEMTSPVLQGLAMISLSLVLFTDAITINLGQLKSNWVVPALALGPVAAMTIGFISFAAVLLFGLPWPLALLVGTILASTDAVLLRDVTRDRRIPLSVRHTLGVEAGANDLIVLPLTLVLAAVAAGVGRDAAEWVRYIFGIVVLAPIVGVAVALVAIRLVDRLRRRRLIRREYESIYSIGVAFAAFAAAQLLGGSGFLAAFAAGITIAVLDVELCDCFLEYGETTAEIAMLVTFVLLGSTLVLTSLAALTWTTVGFALFALFVARPVSMLASLARARLSWDGKLLLAWFGPRGLNSLLLLILALAAGIPQAEAVTGVVGVVVLVSIVLHGVTATPLAAWYGREARRTVLPEETLADAGLLLNAANVLPDRIPRLSVGELARRLAEELPTTVLDVRRLVAGAGDTIPGAIRMPVDDIPFRTDEIPKGAPVVLFCA